MKRLFKPFENLKGSSTTTILLSWLVILIAFWGLNSFGETHLFPTPSQVYKGLGDLWREGLVVHIMSSLWLCSQAVIISVLVSLAFAYSSTIPFYLAILINDARTLQVWVLVVFMTTFLTTSLVQMIKDIPQEEFDHARTLGCNRWECLWEVVIKGRIDYVFELVRQNLAIVWMMLVTVESILVAAGGLGFLIKNGDKLGDAGRVIALQMIIVVVGLSLDFVITKLRKLIFRYSNY
jgi:NitT/TauT family transport system permease protein